MSACMHACIGHSHLLGIRVQEGKSFLRQAIKIGRFYVMLTVSAKIRSQIVLEGGRQRWERKSQIHSMHLGIHLIAFIWKP